jgi:arginase
MMGIRSLDPDERLALRQAGITVQDMRSIDENGVAPNRSSLRPRRLLDIDGPQP